MMLKRLPEPHPSGKGGTRSGREEESIFIQRGGSCPKGQRCKLIFVTQAKLMEVHPPSLFLEIRDFFLQSQLPENP